LSKPQVSDIARLGTIVSDTDMPDVDTTTDDAVSQEQQYQIDIIAELEQRLQKALTSIDSYQNERDELLARIIQLKCRSIELESTLQHVVDILEK
jgi:hypothetical protein